MKIKRVDIGKIVREKAKELEVSPSKLSEMIGIHRQNIEKTVFSKSSIDTNVLALISESLDFDFFQYYRKEDGCNINDYKIGNAKVSVAIEIGDKIIEKTLFFDFESNEDGYPIDNIVTKNTNIINKIGENNEFMSVYGNVSVTGGKNNSACVYGSPPIKIK